MKTILIIEPGVGGHRPVYLERLAEYFLNKKFKVIIGTASENLVEDTIQKLCPAIASRAKFIGLAINLKGYRSRFSVLREIQYWRQAKHLYAKCCKEFEKPDLVFIPFVDNFLNIYSIAGSPFDSTKVAVICMRQTFHMEYGDVSFRQKSVLKIKKYFFKRFLKKQSLSSCYTIDPTLDEYIKRNECAIEFRKLEYLPDPVDEFSIPDDDMLNLLSKFANNKFLLTVYGAIDMRKGVKYIFDAMRCRSSQSDLKVVVAGVQSEDFKYYVSHDVSMREININNILFINKRLSKTEESALFLKANAIWLGYEGHMTMSGVLIKAALYGRKVIGCDNGLIGWFIRKHDLGHTVNVIDKAAVNNALEQLMKTTGKENNVAKLEDHYWSNALKKMEMLI